LPGLGSSSSPYFVLCEVAELLTLLVDDGPARIGVDDVIVKPCIGDEAM
jgi:hypothetical protein